MKKLFCLLLALALVLSACGSKSSSAVYETAAASSGQTNESAMDTGDSGSTALPQGQKFIITVDIRAEAEDLDSCLSAITEKATALGGYLESQNLYNGSAYSGARYRSANLTLRIPADQLDAFTDAVTASGNVVSSSRSVEDVTLEYVDTESRLTALRTEQSRLLELMDQAQTMADLLEIESRLTEVRGELERYASRLKVLENQVDYATVYLDLSEVKEYTPVTEKTRLEKIRDGFLDSVRGVWELLLNTVSFLIIALPYLVVLGLLLWAVIALLRRRRRKHPKKEKAPKAQAEE